jgi:Uma2 family endonuclease
MTAMTTLPFRPDGWTVDDLDDLPDDGYRYELLDGALLVSPPPELPHQYVVSRLIAVLAAQLPDELAAVGAPGLYYDPRNYRIPDVVVFPRSVLTRPHPRLGPADVVVAIELTSPGSLRTDRVLKPAEYAAAGIPHFWRLELDGPLLVTHLLDGTGYREAGRFTGEVALDVPVPVRFRLSELLP